MVVELTYRKPKYIHRYCELPNGASFKYQDEQYVKVNGRLAHLDHDGAENVFFSPKTYVEYRGEC